MNEVLRIIHELPVRLWPTGEKIYNFLDFYEKLKKFPHSKIRCEDLILTPYYISKGKRYEFYELELNIRIVDKVDFQKFILAKTGRSRIRDIPPKVLSIHQNCTIETTADDGTVPVERVIRYIEYLFGNQEVVNQAKWAFGEFKKQCLWFEVY